jgi:hypothetical protein
MSKSVEELAVQCALDVGIALSTAYGQGERKLMPISDRETIVEFAKAIQKALSIQQEADAKDAARWRFLRSNMAFSVRQLAYDFRSSWVVVKQKLDEAIDTAMATPTDSEAKTSA